MMEDQNDPKYDFKAPENNIQKWKPKTYESQAFQGVSPFDFAMRQKNEEKRRKEREREAKAKMYSYHSKGVSTLAEENAKAVNATEQARKEEARRMKEEAKHVNMTETIETNVRSDQHKSEQKYKADARETKHNLKDVSQAAGFGVEQASRYADFQRDQAWKEEKRNQKEAQKHVNMTETIETNVRSDQHKSEQKYKADARETKHNLKDVSQDGDTCEMAIRKEQHDREQKWKETGRNQTKENTKFDMARSLFGGGGVGSAHKEEEAYEEEIVKDDDDDDSYYEEEEETKKAEINAQKDVGFY